MPFTQNPSNILFHPVRGNKLCPTIKKIKSAIKLLQISWCLFLLTICFILITEGFGHLAQPNLNFTEGHKLVMRNWIFTVASPREFFSSPNLSFAHQPLYNVFSIARLQMYCIKRYSVRGFPFLLCRKEETFDYLKFLFSVTSCPHNKTHLWAHDHRDLA